MSPRRYVLALFAVLFVSFTAFAEEFRGVIRQVDAGKKELVVEGRGRHVRGLKMTFVGAANTQVLLGRTPVKLADLKPGQRVRLFYEVRAGRRVMVRITAHGAPPKAAANPAPGPPDPNAVTGTLVRVGLTDREIVMIGPGPNGAPETETTLAVPKSAKITKNGKPLKLDDLQEGEHVTVKTAKRNGKLEAASIQVGAAAAAAPAAKTDNKKMQRLRQLLKLAEWVLQQMDQGQKSGS